MRRATCGMCCRAEERCTHIRVMHVRGFDEQRRARAEEGWNDDEGGVHKRHWQ